MDPVCYALALIEISAADAAHGTIMSVNNSLVCWPLETYATEEQKRKFLAPLAKGEKLKEAEDAGADRIALGVHQHSRILVKPDVRPVAAPRFGAGANDHRLDHGALFDLRLRRGLFDRAHHEVAEPRVSRRRRATELANGFQPTGAGVVRYCETSSHLNHR